MYSTSLVGILSRLDYPHIPFLLFLAFFAFLVDLLRLIEEGLLKVVPLVIAVLLYVEGEGNKLKWILIDSFVIFFQVVVEGLLVADMPVKLKMIMHFYLVRVDNLPEGRFKRHLYTVISLSKSFFLLFRKQLVQSDPCVLLQLITFLVVLPIQAEFNLLH